MHLLRVWRKVVGESEVHRQSGSADQTFECPGLFWSQHLLLQVLCGIPRGASSRIISVYFNNSWHKYLLDNQRAEHQGSLSLQRTQHFWRPSLEIFKTPQICEHLCNILFLHKMGILSTGWSSHWNSFRIPLPHFHILHIVDSFKS